MKKFDMSFWLTMLMAVAMGAAGLALEAQGYKRHFHIHQTSLTSFVVTCDNGADPTLKGDSTTKNEVEISCGK